MKNRRILLVVVLVLSVTMLSGCLLVPSRPFDPSDEEPEDNVLFFEDFDSGSLDLSEWDMSPECLYALEEDPDGGFWLHLQVDGREASGITTFYSSTVQTFDAPYIVEFDFMQPGEERGSGSTYIGQMRPESEENLFYWYLELMPSQGTTVQVYTEDYSADEHWDRRWISESELEFQPDTLYKVKVENEADKTRIIVYSATGEQLTQSPWVTHEAGSAAPLRMGSWIGAGQFRGIIFDNIKVYRP